MIRGAYRLQAVSGKMDAAERTLGLCAFYKSDIGVSFTEDFRSFGCPDYGHVHREPGLCFFQLFQYAGKPGGGYGDAGNDPERGGLFQRADPLVQGVAGRQDGKDFFQEKPPSGGELYLF